MVYYVVTGQIHRVRWFHLLLVQDARVICSCLLTKFINLKHFLWNIDFLDLEKKNHTWCDLNNKLRLLFPTSLWDFCLSVRRPWIHPKVQNYWEGIHKCMHCRCKTPSCTTGGTIQSAVGQGAEISHRRRDFGLFCPDKRDSKMKFNNIAFNKYILGQYVWRRKAW